MPTPVGEKNAPIPAPAARIRSARLPCGTISSSISPARYSPSNTHESCCRGNEQIDLAHLTRGQQGRETGVAVAGVVVHDREVPRAVRDQRVDQLHRLSGTPEPADHHRRTVGDAGDRGRGIRHRLVDHGASAGVASANTSLAMRNAVFAAGTPA